MYINQGPGGGTPQPVLAPQWANQIVRRRAGSSDRPPQDSSGSSTPKLFPSLTGSASSASIANAGDFAHLALPELQARKRELKHQLLAIIQFSFTSASPTLVNPFVQQ